MLVDTPIVCWNGVERRAQRSEGFVAGSEIKVVVSN